MKNHELLMAESEKLAELVDDLLELGPGPIAAAALEVQGVAVRLKFIAEDLALADELGV